MSSFRDREFLLHPEQWPLSSTGFPRTYLKRSIQAQGAIPWELGQIAFCNGKYAFVPETEAFNPDMERLRSGGVELIDQILKEGWLVD